MKVTNEAYILIYDWRNEQTYELRNMQWVQWMNGKKNKQRNGWTSEWMKKEWTKEWMDEYKTMNNTRLASKSMHILCTWSAEAAAAAAAKDRSAGNRGHAAACSQFSMHKGNRQ